MGPQTFSMECTVGGGKLPSWAWTIVATHWSWEVGKEGSVGLQCCFYWDLGVPRAPAFVLSVTTTAMVILHWITCFPLLVGVKVFLLPTYLL